MRKVNLNDQVVATIKMALDAGYYQHNIAAYFGINQGRVSEVKTGKKGGEIRAADQLPPDFPALA